MSFSQYQAAGLDDLSRIVFAAHTEREQLRLMPDPGRGVRELDVGQIEEFSLLADQLAGC